MTHTATPRTDRLAYLAGKSLPVPAQFALAVAVLFVKWEHRRRSRLALSQLDDHLLADIGLKRERAIHEAGLPFWRH